MADETESKTYKLAYKDAFYVGARVTATFILIFFLLGVPAALAIILGLIGGIAARQISALWNAEEVKLENLPQPKETAAPVLIPVDRWFGRFRFPKRDGSRRRRPPRLGE